MEQTNPQTIIIQKKGNGLGTAGFVLSLIAFILCWVPILGFILWRLGAILSVIGVFKAPRGLAIAGCIISGILIILFATALATVIF